MTNLGTVPSRVVIAATVSTLIFVTLSASSANGQQVIRRDTTPRTTQKVVRNASVDSLVECTPVVTPAKKAPTPTRRKATAPRKAVVKKPKPKKVATGTPRPLVRRARRVTPRPAAKIAAHTTTVVMCRPIRPLAALAQDTPIEQSIVPVPRLAPKVAPTAVALPPEAGPPLFVSTAPGLPVMTAGGGRSWLPFALVPAVFLPFIHNGSPRHGSSPPTNPITPPDSVPVTPPIIPPTTVPEPGALVLLGSGLLGLAGVSVRKRRK